MTCSRTVSSISDVWLAETSTSYISLKVATISWAVIPLEYSINSCCPFTGIWFDVYERAEAQSWSHGHEQNLAAVGHHQV